MSWQRAGCCCGGDDCSALYGKGCPKNYHFHGHQASTLKEFDATFIWRPWPHGAARSTCYCLWARSGDSCSGQSGSYPCGLGWGRQWGNFMWPACNKWQLYVLDFPTVYWWDTHSPALPCPSTDPVDWIVYTTEGPTGCFLPANSDFVMDEVDAW
jgi:hypothetical protein